MAEFVVTLAPWAMVTEDFAKAWAHVNMEVSPEDDLLRMLINSATENLESEAKTHIVSRGLITEEFDITSPRVADLWVRHKPIIAVQDVRMDTNRAFGTDTIIPATDYIVSKNRGKITYTGAGGSFPIFFDIGLRVVRVNYWAGFKLAEVPNSWKSLCMETVAWYYYHGTRAQFAISGMSDQQGNRTFVKFDFVPPPVLLKLKSLSNQRQTIARQSTEIVSIDSATPAP